MSITLQIKAFPYNELQGKARERAYSWISEGLNFRDTWGSEVLDTIKVFSSIFPIKLLHVDYTDLIRYQVTDSNVRYLKGLRLRTWMVNNVLPKVEKGRYYGKANFKRSNFYKEICCPFTGVCYDDSILDPILKFIKKPSLDCLFEDLIDDCFYSLISDVKSEIENMESDEYISEHSEANDYLFSEEGWVVHHFRNNEMEVVSEENDQ